MAVVKYHAGKFPPITLNWERLIPLIGPANAALARYDGILRAVPNAAVLLSPLMTQEAVLSSKIEGTQTTMGEVLEFEAEGPDANMVSAEKRDNIEEVLNYRRAMRRAEELMRELPLCQRVVCEAHRILLDGVRGKNKAPGEYRRIQNWIGPPGSDLENAKFVPIAAEKLPEAMSAWERYIHTAALDRLVQVALLHIEFEALHPFLDGNGRLGRMLIPLLMVHYGLLEKPMFYISAYFERKRDTYYEKLLAVSRDNAWTAWVEFFLRAVVEQAGENQNKATAILELYRMNKERFLKLTRSQYSMQMLDFVFEKPIFRSTDFIIHSKIPKPTALRILKLLRDAGVLGQIRGGTGRRAGIFTFPALLNIAEGTQIF